MSRRELMKWAAGLVAMLGFASVAEASDEAACVEFIEVDDAEWEAMTNG